MATKKTTKVAARRAPAKKKKPSTPASRAPKIAKHLTAEGWRPKRRGLMLRTCGEGMTAHGGFVWPTSGHISAPDWQPRRECGNGLHGLLWGEGDGSLLNADTAKHWLVVEVDLDEVVELSGKVKVPEGNVIHCGDVASATAYLAEHGEKGRKICYGTSTSGDGGIQ